MESFVSAIRQEYRNLLSLHSHHQLAEAFGINRIHFKTK
jgi:thiamine-phosphate pyrophosphorylase